MEREGEEGDEDGDEEGEGEEEGEGGRVTRSEGFKGG